MAARCNRLTSLSRNGKLTISKLEEQWENYKMSFQMSDDIEVCKGYKKLSLQFVFVTFSFMGSLARRQKTWCYSA